MATTNTTLYKIELPNLSSNSFGSDLRQAFENIDSNFQKLSTLGLTTGEAGAPAIWVPFNLNCVFKGFDPNDDSFIKYQEIINGGEDAYQETCFELYKLLLEALPDDTQQVGIYKHKWEYDYAPFSDRNTPYDDKYDPYLPGILLIAGNIDVDDSGNHSFRMLGSTAHIYMDPRFRAQLQHTPMSEDIINQMAQATDQSCVLYGKAADITAQNPLGFEFEYVYAFPRIYCGPDGNFYLNINNIDTNIPLNGRAGAAGKDANIVAVHLSDDVSTAVIDDILYNNDDSQNGQNLEVTSFVGTNTAISPEDAPNLDGCPALIFPPKGYGRYGSFYWVGYLSYDGSLTAYCGRENLITTDIYEHNFGGMMMGLDMYEAAKARPTGNAPWYKPRGLMLPIGTRAYGDYWDPRDDTGDQPNISQFGAHLIYSKKDASNLKKEIHLSSVQDYRSIGITLDSQAQPDYTQNIERVDGTVFVIDEPVKITNYGNESPLYEGDILTAFGSSLIKGNEHIDGDLTVDGYGTIGEYLCVGAGDNNGIASGDVYANKFYRRTKNAPGQILMANGWSTINEPICLRNSNISSDPNSWVWLKLKDNLDDGTCYFEGDIKDIAGGVGEYKHYVTSGHTSALGNTSYSNWNTNWGWPVGIIDKTGGLSNTDISSVTNISNNKNVHWIADQKVIGKIAIVRLLISANSNSDTWDITDVAQNHYAYGIPMDQDAATYNWNIGLQLDTKMPKPKHPIVQRASGWGQYKNFAGNRTHHVMVGGLSVRLDQSGVFTVENASCTTAMIPGSQSNNRYIELTYIYHIDEDSSSTNKTTYYWKQTSAPTGSTSLELNNPKTTPNPDWYVGNSQSWWLVWGSYSGTDDLTGSVNYGSNEQWSNWGYIEIEPSSSSGGGGDITDTTVTYQWLSENNDSYNIINYLNQTQLAVVNNNNTASGPIIDVLRSSGTSYGRWDGPHGTVSITKTDTETDTETNTEAHITVEAWDEGWDHITCQSYKVILGRPAEGSDLENISFDEGQQTITVTLKSNQNS